MKWDMFFQGAMSIVFPDVPRATFIQGGTFIPESRVIYKMLCIVTKIQN